jgi:hypothetical protein
VDSAAGSNLLMPTSSTWKLNMPMASFNPPVIVEFNPVARQKRLVTADVGEPMMTGYGVSMVAGGGMSMAIAMRSQCRLMMMACRCRLLVEI